MNKRVLILLLLITILLISSCLKKGGRSRMLTSDKEKANYRLEQILKAIKDKDKEALKVMFSKQALSEANDIDGGIEYIMNFYKGKINSKDITVQTNESIDYGNKIITLNCFCIVTTDTDEYIVFFIDQIVDTLNHDNVGLYMLQIIKLADRKKEFDWGSKTRCAGIYRPSTKK